MMFCKYPSMSVILLVVVVGVLLKPVCVAVSQQSSTCKNPDKEDPLRLPDEWMNQDSASGPCVVQAVIDNIKCSNIFEPDHGFLRRIAYAETKDGVELPENNDGGYFIRHVGIWGLSVQMLSSMAQHIYGKHSTLSHSDAQHLINQSNYIYKMYGVNVTDYFDQSESHLQNFSNPLANGLTARFYLSYIEMFDGNLPRTLSGQAGFWWEHYRNNKSKNLILPFEDIESEGKGQYQCFNCTVEEWMTYRNTSGPCIVESVLKRINDSQLFEKDYGLMRRIAYVETRDGREMDNRSGIWGVNNIMIENMNNMTSINQYWEKFTNKNLSVTKEFGINIFSPEVINHPRNPLVSAIIARLYLYYLTLVFPPESLLPNLDAQATFWKARYRHNDQVANNTDFKRRIMEIEGCRVNTDIVFVLDGSNSVRSFFNIERDFVVNFVKSLRIDPNDDRVGVVLFGTNAHKEINFSSYTNKKDLIFAIQKIMRPKEGFTNISDALRLTREMFNASNRTSVLRIAIVVSDGKSQYTNVEPDPQATNDTAYEANKLHDVKPAVTVYSIGVKQHVDKSEMVGIAGSESRYTPINSFYELNPMRQEYLTDICCYTYINAEENKTYTTKATGGEIIRFVRYLSVNGVTIRICVTEGNVSIFVSKSDDGYETVEFKCGYKHNNVCMCRDTYTGFPSRKRDVSTEVHISIEGMEDENVFTLEFIDGDVSTDCVGPQRADDCEKDETPTSHKEASKKKTVIIASVTSTGSFLICCSVILGVIIGWVAKRQQKKKKLRKDLEDEVYNLLDNEYTEM